jgi:hypothetical protein
VYKYTVFCEEPLNLCNDLLAITETHYELGQNRGKRHHFDNMDNPVVEMELLPSAETLALALDTFQDSEKGTRMRPVDCNIETTRHPIVVSHPVIWQFDNQRVVAFVDPFTGRQDTL